MSKNILDRSDLYFENHHPNDLEQEIQNVYLENKIPFVIGYSGGKDSTATVQLVWNAIVKLPEEQRDHPVYILSSDTLVETPVIVGHIRKNIDLMKQEARNQNLPFHAELVTPRIQDSFWVNLIGKGYSAPSKNFRWCTDRLKIRPANQFITDRLREFGSTVVVLGARKSESVTRQQVIELKSRQIPGSLLTHHSTLPSAYCYTPIAELKTADVWDYLLNTPSPWGAKNRDLVTIYRNAQDGECPLVVDSSTGSCGNSRFGCWVCTVVKQDHSMEALIDNGEQWLEPLLDFRDFLALTQDPEAKQKYRNFKRRNGTISTKVIKKEGKTHNTDSVVPGPYWLWFRKELLRKLLETEKTINNTPEGKEFSLIRHDELLEIRRLWRMEEVEDPDWEDSVPKIYKEITGKELEYQKDDTGEFSLYEDQLLRSICEKHQFPIAAIKKMLVAEKKTQGMNRRTAIFKNLRCILNEDWRTKEEFLKDLKENESIMESVV